MADNKTWGSSFFGRGRAAAGETPDPQKCGCDWFADRMWEGKAVCFACYGKLSGLPWDSPCSLQDSFLGAQKSPVDCLAGLSLERFEGGISQVLVRPISG